VLADEAVDMVVNLTIQEAHYPVTRQCIEAGKHVHSEKPLSITRDEAAELVALAEAQGVRLACSPFTWMGEAQQTAWKAIRDGELGQVRLVYAEMNWGRIELWHPAPANFYRPGVGPLPDVGVYPLAVLTAFFGPVQRVRGFASIMLPERTAADGSTFSVGAPDVVIAVLEFHSGVVARLTPTFYVRPTTQHGIELHGDVGSMHLGSAHDFQAPLRFAPATAGDWEDVPYVRKPYPGVEWGRAIFDVVEALREDRPHRASAAQAAHVVDICNAIFEAGETGSVAELSTTFDPPAPMAWAR
jgi:predicted dehydrogenase